LFRKSGELFVEVEIFDAETFETKADREARGEHALTELPKIVEKIPLSEIGFDDYFMGSLYHFNTPIHDKDDKLYTTYKFNGETYNKIEVTLPKLMKIVFDEYKIDYNVTNLLKSIGKSGSKGV
jgi:hypothetical protein